MPRKYTRKNTKKEESDEDNSDNESKSEEEYVEKPVRRIYKKKTTTPTKKTTRNTRKKKEESEDEDNESNEESSEESVKKKKTTTPTKRTTRNTRKKKEESEDEEEEEEEEEKPRRGRPPAKNTKKSTPKKKKEESDEEVDIDGDEEMEVKEEKPRRGRPPAKNAKKSTPKKKKEESEDEVDIDGDEEMEVKDEKPRRGKTPAKNVKKSLTPKKKKEESEEEAEEAVDEFKDNKEKNKKKGDIKANKEEKKGKKEIKGESDEDMDVKEDGEEKKGKKPSIKKNNQIAEKKGGKDDKDDMDVKEDKEDKEEKEIPSKGKTNITTKIDEIKIVEEKKDDIGDKEDIEEKPEPLKISRQFKKNPELLKMLEDQKDINYEDLNLFDLKKFNLYKDKYPDEWWRNDPPVQIINKDNPLEITATLNHAGAIYAVKWSHDGTMLATISTLGTIKIWDADTFELICEIRDENEKNIEEFFVCQWTPDDKKIIVAGKLQNRYKWSKEDDDNAILPCPIKSFEVLNPKVVKVSNGHQEEVLCIKILKFKNKNYMISSSQDGYLLKWNMDDEYNILKSKKINDLTTNIAISISFVPDCGNKYFLCSGDHAVKIYDFETEELLQSFPDLYTCYCDSIVFLKPNNALRKELDKIESKQIKPFHIIQEEEEKEEIKRPVKKNLKKPVKKTAPKKVPPKKSAPKKNAKKKVDPEENFEETLIPFHIPYQENWQPTDVETNTCFYLLTKGVEYIEEDQKELKPIKETEAHLRRFIFPKGNDGPYKLETVVTYADNNFVNVTWLLRMKSNGNYVFIPTSNGKIFIFNILTGFLTSVLADHDKTDVRDISFHPYKKLIATCADDSKIIVYKQKD